MIDTRLQSLFDAPSPLAEIAGIEHPHKHLILECVEKLRSPESAGRPAVAFFVPGRIEVLGKHTDYCGGRSLLCTVNRGFVIVAQKRKDQLIRLINVRGNEQSIFDASAAITPTMGHWSNYPMTVARRVVKNFSINLAGMDLAFVSDLPPAAGLSSSSAFIVGTFLAIASLNELHRSEIFTTSIQSLEDLAHYCGCIENGSGFRELAGDSGVGTSGGSQDQTAILCCKQGMLSQYGFAPVTHQRDVSFSEVLEFVILGSGVIAEKTGAAREKYNRASDRARRIVTLWNQTTGEARPTLASIVRAGLTHQLRELMSATDRDGIDNDGLVDRLDQFVMESEQIIPAAAEAMARQQYDVFADCVARSVDGAVKLLGNQVPQTIELTKASLQCGAIAASPFGAGFGGSVWALLKRTETEGFLNRLRTAGLIRDEQTYFATSPTRAASRP